MIRIFDCQKIWTRMVRLMGTDLMHLVVRTSSAEEGTRIMSRVSFEVPPEQKALLTNQARSLGVSLTCYARNLVLDGSKRNGQNEQAEVFRAIRALVPLMVKLSSKVTPEHRDEWRKAMLEAYEKERAKP